MQNFVEPSACLSFTSSSYLSNGASSCNLSSLSSLEQGANTDLPRLSKLSANLETLLVDSEFDCTDAEIVVDGVSIGVHRCILSARSKFFRELFSQGTGPSSSSFSSSSSSFKSGEKPKYDMSDLVPHGIVGHEALMIFLNYVYTGKLKQSPMEVSTCCDISCAHDACRPAVTFVVELMYAFSVFQVSDLVPNLQRRLLNFTDKALVEDVIPILLVAFHCHLDQLRSHCVQRIARSDLDCISIEKELPHEVSQEIKLIRINLHSDNPSSEPVDPIHEKRIRRIHKALDSDDVELVKLLLTESNVTLDDAYALHYAVSYCDSKIVAEVLGLGLANINLKNPRGYTPLHVAAMRREPAVMVSLLNKGASAGEMTADGRCAVRICQRLTRAKDFYAKIEQCQEANKDKLCIDILEREMRRNPVAEDESISSPIMADDLQMKLVYLENRVACARWLFPAEAKVAMKIAHADATSDSAGPASSFRNQREVDLNETPTIQHKRLRSRMDSLLKTVELGRRFFPHCSQVLDKVLEDDVYNVFCLQNGTPDDQKLKRLKFCELKVKQEAHEAFTKDKAESCLSGLSSSSSS